MIIIIIIATLYIMRAYMLHKTTNRGLHNRTAGNVVAIIIIIIRAYPRGVIIMHYFGAHDRGRVSGRSNNDGCTAVRRA